MSYFLSLLHSRLFPPSDPTNSFTGLTVLITGANTGLGFEAALKFTLLQASTVILACRSPTEGAAAVARISHRSNRPASVLKVWPLDLNSYGSITAFAQRVEDELPEGKLDVVLLNAGVLQPRWKLSPEQWEETLQVNLLSTVLLGILLLPSLKKKRSRITDPTRSQLSGAAKDEDAAARPAHLCFVSSGNYEFADVAAPLSLKACSQPAAFRGAEQQYNLSKLFLMCAVEEFASHVAMMEEEWEEEEEGVGGETEKDGQCAGAVIINAANPGATATNLARNIDSWPLRILAFVYLRVLARTPEQGSRSLVGACAMGRGFWFDGRLQESVEQLSSSIHVFTYLLPRPDFRSGRCVAALVGEGSSSIPTPHLVYALSFSNFFSLLSSSCPSLFSGSKR